MPPAVLLKKSALQQSLKSRKLQRRYPTSPHNHPHLPKFSTSYKTLHIPQAKAAEEAEKAEQAAEAAAAAAAEAGEEDTPPPPPDADPKPEGSSEAPEAAPETPADEAAAATEEAEKEEEKQEDVILTTKPGMTTLSYLDLSDCEVGSKGLKALANVLSDNNTSLRTLSLKRNKFGIKKMTPPAADEDTPPQRVEQGGVVTPGIVALGSCLAATSLTELDIGGNLIGPANGVVLFEGLLKNRGLVGLGLESNRLGGVGPDGPRCAEDENNVAKCLQTLSSALLQSKTLTTLRLRGNMLGTAGAALLAQGLTETCTLTSLDLSHNYLLDEGVATICSALTAIPGLTSLGLAGMQKNGRFNITMLRILRDIFFFFPIFVVIKVIRFFHISFYIQETNSPSMRPILSRRCRRL